MEGYLNDRDKSEIKNVINFSNGLILFDKVKAEENETVTSQRNADPYLTAYYGLDENQSINERNRIIENYEELNPYYKELNEKYGIICAVARIASDLSILKITEKTLDTNEEKLFCDCFYESLNYYKKIISTEAFKNQTYNRGFIKLFLLFSSVQKYLTRKMDNFFNIDTYDARTLKNAFISAGLDYFETMPIEYQRRLLKKLNDLIANKGDNQCLFDIVEIFGFDNIQIYKYVLAKGYNTKKENGGITYNEPFLFFYKTPYNKEVDTINDMKIDYDPITSKDIYWFAQKEEILDLEFNLETSKYLSVDTSINIMRDSLNLSYFLNLLFQIANDNKDEELTFFNKNISSNPISIVDGFIALISLVLRSNGYKDTITKNPDSINFVYGYNDIDNKIDVSGIINSIISRIVLNKGRIKNDELIYNFFKNNFKMKSYNEFQKVSIEDFLNVFNHNQKMRKTLEDFIIESEDYHLYRDFRSLWDIEMKTKLNNKLFGDSETFLDYIKSRNYELYSFIYLDRNIQNTQDKVFFFFRDAIFELSNSLSTTIGDKDITVGIHNSPFIGITNYIQYYIYTLVLLFKAYTVDLLSTDIVLVFDDKMRDSVRIFDECSDGEITELQAERIDLLDVPNYYIYDKYNDTIGIKDKVDIQDLDGSYEDKIDLKDDINVLLYENEFKDNLNIRDEIKIDIIDNEESEGELNENK